MSKNIRWLLAVLLALVLVAAACGSDDDDDSSSETETEATEEAEPEEEATEEAAPEEEATEEAMDEEEEAAPETDELVATFDANGDGTITIGVAAAGPRDDGAYYQSIVDFAEEFSAENGFAEPIVADNIGSAEAAQAMSDLAQQGVDIMLVGASEIAEPLPDLTEEFSEIFWYCNCGAGFEELPGLAQATDWGAAIHYTRRRGDGSRPSGTRRNDRCVHRLLRYQLRAGGLQRHAGGTGVSRPVLRDGLRRHR